MNKDRYLLLSRLGDHPFLSVRRHGGQRGLPDFQRLGHDDEFDGGRDLSGAYRRQLSPGQPERVFLSYNLRNPYYDLVLGGNVYGSQTTSSMAASLNSQANYDIIGGVNGDHFPLPMESRWGFRWMTA